MKQIVQTSRNLSLRPVGDDDKLEPCIELVLSIMEPCYTAGVVGLTRTERIEDVRLYFTPKTLRDLGKSFDSYADDAEKVCAEWILKVKSA